MGGFDIAYHTLTRFFYYIKAVVDENLEALRFESTSKVITDVIEAGDSGNSNSGFTAIWKFILEIPQNVLNVVQGFPMVKKILPSAETLTVAVNYQLIVYGSFTNDGDIIIDGDLVIL